MLRLAVGVALIFAALIAPALAAENSGQAAQCRRAEINPVTGHVFCFDPLGAPVETPPEEMRPDCKAEEARGQWSWSPNCTPSPGEM
jgi:hypothetical protein